MQFFFFYLYLLVSDWHIMICVFINVRALWFFPTTSIAPFRCPRAWSTTTTQTNVSAYFVYRLFALHHLFLYISIWFLEISHVCKIDRNHPSIVYIVMFKKVLPESFDGMQIKISATCTNLYDEHEHLKNHFHDIEHFLER